MYILGIAKADSAGRVGIGKLFEDTPERVVVAFDADAREIVFIDEKEAPSSWWINDFRIVDEKMRVCLPAWMRKEFGDEFLITDDCLEKHRLIPRKFLNSF